MASRISRFAYFSGRPDQAHLPRPLQGLDVAQKPVMRPRSGAAPGSARIHRQLASNDYINATDAPLTRTYVASVTPEFKQWLVSIHVTG
jgi:hypothetical protein